MAYVSIDIDMDEIDTDDLVEELCDRVKSFGRQKLTDKHKEDLRTDIMLLYEILFTSTGELPSKSLEDQMKIDLLKSKWNEFTFWQLEEKLK